MVVSIVPKKLDNIATWMKPTPFTSLPSVLKGIFFMDGNPLPDDCLTLQNLEWNEKTLSLTVFVGAPLQWTFHRSILGRALLFGARLMRFRYIIRFEDSSLFNAQIIPIFLGISIPLWLVNATMYQPESTENGDIWQRKNVWLGGIPRIGEYVMRRIVDEHGQYTPAFQDMLDKVNVDCLVVQTSTSPPTSPPTSQ